MIAPNRKHGRKSFFKYMPSSTAEIVLSNSTLRWSSPFEFNDPFDVPRELAFDISPKEIQIALVRSLENLISNPPQNSRGLDPKIQLIVERVKNNPTEELKSKSSYHQQSWWYDEAPSKGALL